MASSVDNIISMFQQRAMQNAYKNVGARNVNGNNFRNILNKSVPDSAGKNNWVNNYTDSYSKNFNDLNSSYKNRFIGENAVNNKYLKMQSVLSASNTPDLTNAYDKFFLSSVGKQEHKAFLNSISSSDSENKFSNVIPGHITPIRNVENIWGTKSIGEEISSGISNQINNIKSSEEKLNQLSEVEDVDSMEFVTNVHNLELQVKQFNLVMNKIVDVLKSLLYNTQI